MFNIHENSLLYNIGKQKKIIMWKLERNRVRAICEMKFLTWGGGACNIYIYIVSLPCTNVTEFGGHDVKNGTFKHATFFYSYGSINPGY